MKSNCGVQSKKNCESHESCVCIAGFSACGCDKKSVAYEAECRHVLSLLSVFVRTSVNTNWTIFATGIWGRIAQGKLAAEDSRHSISH